jgi:hypothetical protein
MTLRPHRRFADGPEFLPVTRRDFVRGAAAAAAGLAGLTPGLGDADPTGVRPNGRNYFSAGLDAVQRRGGELAGPPGCLEVGCYNMDQGRKWGDLLFPTGEVVPARNKSLLAEGFTPRPDFKPERGRWYCYELMVKTNTPGQRDGRVAFWVDGKLTGDFPNLRLRSVPILRASRINIITYSSRLLPNATLWYDDFVAATSYIGPQAPGPK